jgi:hypothetical protein
MLVGMTSSFESEPDRTDPSIQDLPTIPAVQEREAWGKQRVITSVDL